MLQDVHNSFGQTEIILLEKEFGFLVIHLGLYFPVGRRLTIANH